MKTIPLTRGYVAIVDDEDFDRLSKHRWCVYKSRTGGIYAYSTRRPPNRLIMHRYILGVTDPKIDVDHRNRNGLDNQRKNRRQASRSQNNFNATRRRDNKAGAKGVSHVGKPLRKPFRAYINANGHRTYLGYFATLEEAATARNIASISIHGDFRRAA